MHPHTTVAPEPARVGVFGGTFDPIHCGHLAAALAARDALHLDEVLLVVANDPWKKSLREIAPAADRLALVEAAVEGEYRLVACDAEIVRGGTSYTVDTLDQLSRSMPGARLFLIVGTDILNEMESWERSERLSELAKVAVITRAGSSPPAGAIARWRAEVVWAETPDVSSTAIREKLRSGAAAEGLVPPPVSALIASRGLYGVHPKLMRR